MKKHETAYDALNCILPGDRVFLHGSAATPEALIEGLLGHADRLTNVEIIHLHTHGEAKYADEEYASSFRVANLFVGSNIRRKLDGDRVDYLPLFLSEIPALFRSRRRAPDVALIHVSCPDKHGYCTLGVSVDVARAAVESSRTVVAQINPQMPRVHGDGFIHISEIDHYIQIDTPLIQVPSPILSEEEKRIGLFCAELVEDGATLQMGIGAIPDAVLAALTNHRHLGVHTELWSDGLLPLIESGAVDNSRKVKHTGKNVATFAMGTQKTYDFVHDNPFVNFFEASYINNVSVISKNPKVTAINSAVEVDLSGQICADSIGHHIISGVGGQMDFIRAARLSKGGKPIIALPSRTKKGQARIVPTLKPGAGVVTTRAHTQFVITEYGIADLYGKTMNERAHALIKIAHPGDRELLSKQWHERRCRWG